MSGASLGWPVPARRCVVRRRIAYRELVSAWIAELERAADALVRWYDDLTPAGVARGLARLRAWHALFFDEGDGADVARDEENTLDLPPAFPARLWKGPLRVLVEPAAFDEHGNESALRTNPVRVDYRAGGTLVLELSERREVVNADAVFLMGDLVELPLFTFLREAGVAGFDGVEFDPAGSPFLGTSVRAGKGGAAPCLPENVLGMRFQLLVSLARGAFSREGEPVFLCEGRRSQNRERPAAAQDGYRVWARGMMYAGTLARPTRKKHWRVQNYDWGLDVGPENLVQNVATRAAIEGLPADLPVTPGWTCSPATLMLSHYLLDFGTGHAYGGGSVRKTMTQKKYEGRALRDVYAGLDDDGLVAKVRATVPDLAPHVETLRKEIDAILALLRGEGSVAAAALGAAEGGADDWEQVVPARLRRTLRRTAARPHDFHGALRRHLLGRRLEARERALLEELRLDLLARVVHVRERVEALESGESWRLVPADPRALRHGARLPDGDDLARERDEGVRRKGAPQLRDFSGGGGRSLWSQLRRKRKRLDRVGTGPLGGLEAVDFDMSDLCTDLTIVSLDGHEWALVRLRPHDHLLRERTLPRSGFLTAFDPLSGEDYAPADTDPERGQLYVFEATGRLGVWEKEREQGGSVTYKAFGAKPFRFQPLVDNQLRVAVDPKRKGRILLRQRVRDSGGREVVNGSSKPLEWIWTLDDTGRERMRSAHDTLSGWLPIVVEPTREGAEARVARRRMVDGAPLLYAERAAPFPTIEETRGGFAAHDEMLQAVDELEWWAALYEPSDRYRVYPLVWNAKKHQQEKQASGV